MIDFKIIGIIPARYGSTRFPGKPLFPIKNKPMIQWVYENSKKSKALDKVIVATDDDRIYNACIKFGAQAIMTSSNHKSGTERCYEAYHKLNEPYDAIVNIQGDEPFVHQEHIHLVTELLKLPNTQIASLAKPFLTSEFEKAKEPNKVKVVLNTHSEAMYFSRSIIPYNTTNVQEKNTYFKHVGIYGYKPEILKQIVTLNMEQIEKMESLEQLRWLYNGYTIKMALTDKDSVGVDTKEDLIKLEGLNNI